MQVSISNTANLKALLTLNQSALPQVSSLTLYEMQKLKNQCAYLRAAIVDDSIVGFLLALEKGQDYDSLNYRWFCERYDSFVYIDRVIIGEGYRGRGIGKALYDDIEKFAADRAECLTCEVNIIPPNPISMSFHQKFGFVEAGQQKTESGKKTVSLLVKQLHAESAMKMS